MQQHITKIGNDAKYIDDFERIQAQLDDTYRSFLLEETAPDAANIIRCFISGSYYYRKTGFPVYAVKEFLRLLKSVTQEKRRIIMANLHTRIDSITRYDANTDIDYDVPF